MKLFPILLISVLDLEQWFVIYNGELADHGARPKNAPVQPNVVAEYLPEDAPKFEATVKGLVTRPHASLHLQLLHRVAIVVGALYFFGVPHIAVVGFHPLAWLEKVGEFVEKNLNVRPGAGGVGSADPDQIPRENIYAELVAERGLACIFVGTKWVPPHRGPLLLDAEVRPVDGH
jgi:hypothetical protein